MSIFKRPNSPFYYCEFHREGRRVVRSTRTASARDARAFERRLRDQVAKEQRETPIAPALTVDQACGQYWDEHGHRLRWASEVARHLRLICQHIDKDTPLALLGAREVTALVQARRAEGAGAPAVNRTLSVLQGVHNRASGSWELTVRAIVWKLHRLKEPKERVRFLTLDEARRLIAALPFHAALIVRFLLLTGLRKREVMNLTWTDVLFERAAVKVLAKGGHKREVVVGPEALLVLHEAPRIDRHVFDATNFRKLWEAALVAAGIEDFRLHDLRHTHATWLRQQGVPLEVIRDDLGHSSIAVTQKYAHVEQSEVRAALQTLPSLGPTVPRAGNKGGYATQPLTQERRGAADALPPLRARAEHQSRAPSSGNVAAALSGCVASRHAAEDA